MFSQDSKTKTKGNFSAMLKLLKLRRVNMITYFSVTPCRFVQRMVQIIMAVTVHRWIFSLLQHH